MPTKNKPEPVAPEATRPFSKGYKHRNGEPVSDACGEGRHAECDQDLTKCHCTFRTGHTVLHAYMNPALRAAQPDSTALDAEPPNAEQLAQQVWKQRIKRDTWSSQQHDYWVEIAQEHLNALAELRKAKP